MFNFNLFNMKDVVTTIDKTTMVEILKEIQYGQFVHLETLTTVDMYKRNNPYYERVKKYSSKNVRCLPDYKERKEKERRKRMEEDPTYQVKPTWFHHISPCVVKHNNNENLYYMYERFEKLPVKNSYTIEGKLIEREVFGNFVKPKVTKDVDVYVVKIENIKKMSIDGKKYVIK
jgi:hypothetical protein